MSPLLDRFGRPFENSEVRMSLGFVPQQLRATEPETITGLGSPGATAEWVCDGSDDTIRQRPRCQ